METETTDAISVLRKYPAGRCDYVTVTAPAGVTDEQLAAAAGFGARHYGRHVERHDDGNATVTLWND